MAQTTISFTLDRNLWEQCVVAAVATYNYQPNLNGLPNPVSAAEFTANILATFAKQMVLNHRAQQAADAARQQTLHKLAPELEGSTIDVSVSD